MNAVATTIIGVVGTGLISAFFVVVRMLFGLIGNLSKQIERFEEKCDGKFGDITADVHALETKLTDKFTGETKELEVRLADKFTRELTAQGERIDRVHNVLREHGERLARIELKLDIDPPAEAA